MAYTIIRTDLMSGTNQPEDLLSVRFYGSDNKPAAVENGVIVKIGDLESGEREIYKATAADASADLAECAVVAGVEVMYEDDKKKLSDFINKAGKATRCFVLRNRNVFSVTAEGFVGGTVPAAGESVSVGTGGKLVAKTAGLGKCIAVETVGGTTYYAIRIGKVAATTADDTKDTGDQG